MEHSNGLDFQDQLPVPGHLPPRTCQVGGVTHKRGMNSFPENPSREKKRTFLGAWFKLGHLNPPPTSPPWHAGAVAAVLWSPKQRAEGPEIAAGVDTLEKSFLGSARGRMLC